WTKEVYVWDLDRTYLRTEFDSLRDLIRTALQKAKDKVAYPGVSALMRALRGGPEPDEKSKTGRRPIYFVSASPPQIRKVILEKFALDGVEIDGVYFKEHMRNVRPSQARWLRVILGLHIQRALALRQRTPNQQQ